MDVGRLAARYVIGGLFVGHGTQKLAGWFGGPGLAGTDQMMTALQMHPPRRNALAAGVSETAGGALLAAGLATPLAAASLIGTMVTAIRKVHLKNGVWAQQGGYEYNLVLIAALVALVDAGPGDLSLDSVLGRERKGSAWALGALALGALASTGAIAAGKAGTPAEPPAAVGPVADATGEAAAGDPVTST